MLVSCDNSLHFRAMAHSLRLETRVFLSSRFVSVLFPFYKHIKQLAARIYTYMKKKEIIIT